jgi:tetratricopeptide (TPR) repeat protein
MPQANHQQGEALKRAVLAALIEAADALPGVGPFLAGAGTLYRELRQMPRDLPTEARRVVQAMARDFQAFLVQEAPRHAEQTVAVGLLETFAILSEHGLSADELTREAELDATRAARRTLDRAVDHLRLLEADIEALVRRLVGEYYSVLLTHREALDHVGVPTLRALLERTHQMERDLRDLVHLVRALLEREEQAVWQALCPVEEPVAAEGPIQLAEVKAPNRLVPFRGEAHHRLQDELVAWAQAIAEGPNRADLCLVFGPGGAGKTRLAVEAGRALKGQGWQAYFLPSEPFSADQVRVWALPNRPTLLILDYVENWVTEAEVLLKAVADASDCRQHPLALLFLLRPDPQDKGQPLHGVLSGVAERSPTQTIFWNRVYQPALEAAREVPALALDDRPALFREARQTFSKRVEVAPRKAVTYPAEKLPERPLAVILLALLAAQGRRVAESRDERRIFSYVWDWERDKWRRHLSACGLKPDWKVEALDLTEAALIAATLGRPFRSPEEVAAFWEAHLPPQEMTPNGRTLSPRWLAQHLPALFPVRAEESTWRLTPIVPDPLADQVLAQRLAQQPGLVSWALPTPEEIPAAVAAGEHLAEAAGERSPADELEALAEVMAALEPLVRPLRALEVLARLDTVPEEGKAVAQRGRKAVNEWLLNTSQALEESEARDFLQALDEALPAPDRTLALRAVQEPLYRAMFQLAPDEAGQARAQGMLGYALSALGRREEALAATQEAVDIRRRLAEANPQAFLPDLASSLNNLGRDLSNLGRREEALAATQEAVRALAPFFLRFPAAFASWMETMARNYVEKCEALGREPDGELLGPVVEAFQGLEALQGLEA